MNVARSTLVRRGYLLTALAVAVLLVATSGTAWAQSIRFSTSRATLAEGASADNATPDPLKVTIARSGNFDKPDDDTDEDRDPQATFADFVGSNATHLALEVVEYDGSPYDASNFPFTIQARSGDATTLTTVTPGASASFGFGTEASRTDGVATTIELTIQNTPPDRGDWNDETFVLRLSAITALDDHLTSDAEGATARRVGYGIRQLTVTVDDIEKTRSAPRFRFKPTDIQLAKGNKLTMTAGVGTGASGVGDPSSAILATLFALDGESNNATGDDVLLSVNPADAVGRIVKIYKGNAAPANDAATDLATADPGTYIVSKIGGAAGVIPTASTNDGITLTIEAIDVSGFRDEQVSLTLMDGRTDAEMRGEGGPIDDSVPATVTVLSGEDTPTVTFSKESVSIDEGGMETVHLLADGDQGDQVGSVAVSVSGEATIVLEQGGDRISGGVVQFGDSANAELTIRALPDLTLEDGEEKMATVTITDASGANIGDPRELMVTVVGSTAVPVLPLIGQLILALLLTAGGARLYRRRQQ